MESPYCVRDSLRGEVVVVSTRNKRGDPVLSKKGDHCPDIFGRVIGAFFLIVQQPDQSFTKIRSSQPDLLEIFMCRIVLFIKSSDRALFFFGNPHHVIRPFSKLLSHRIELFRILPGGMYRLLQRI